MRSEPAEVTEARTNPEVIEGEPGLILAAEER
jgi:hypothetical protein